MNPFSPKNLFRRGAMFARRWLPPMIQGDHQATIGRELQVKLRARECGRNNLPATSDAAPDVVQQQIIDRFGTGAEDLTQALWRRLKGALDLVVQRIPEKLDLQSIADAAELAIVRVRDRARSTLIALRKHERDRWRDLSAFRSANGLTGRSAQYTQPWPPLKVWVWIVLALVGESFLNGAIFAEASPDYWQGGVIQALAFSGINILLGFFFLGLIAARYASHVTSWKRIAGIVGVIVVVIIGILFNMYVAHYREVIESVPLDQIDALAKTSYVDAAKHMREHPFEFTTWQSIVLLIIGLAVFLGLAIKGYFVDDPYPRYGHHERAAIRARRAYERAKQDVKKAVEKEIDAAAKKLKRRIEAEARRVDEAREIVAESEEVEREVADSAADLARACTVNLRDYREVNAYVRTDQPPTYFKEYPTFSVKLPEMAEIARRFQDAVDWLERNRVTANQIEKHLNEVSKAELDAFLAYVDDIEQEEAAQRTEEETLRKAA